MEMITSLIVSKFLLLGASVHFANFASMDSDE